ncbi:MAG TPA: GTPase ObgE [Candidatus Solibacter sp.]|nr:GTPase ObgE [Candidatus Solibacter sp.]
MFLDEVRIHVRSGAGGSGAVTFRKEKYVPRGGPDGGDGGRGGDVILVASKGLTSLAHFKGRRLLAAQRGGAGSRNLRHGAAADPVRVLVPLGSTVRDAQSGELIGELNSDGEELVVARGGRGGRGNAHFADSRNQAPRYAELGTPAEEKEVILELTLIADVGLVGAPNAGKSTLLAGLTAATPRIASYPFTTLEPNLGVVSFEDGERLVLADVPGLIEGASEGVGLGTEFLKHLSKTAVLVHVVDASLAPLEARAAYDHVVSELRQYDEQLPGRVRVVALNKIDLPEAELTARRLAKDLKAEGLVFHKVSARDGYGLEPLLDSIRASSRTGRRTRPAALRIYHPEPALEKIRVRRREDSYQVLGKGVEAIVARTDVNNPEALARMRRQLDVAGLREALLDAGAGVGDTVMIGTVEFLFDPDL